MKRLVVTLAALLMLLGLTAQGIAAQDASPAAGGTPATPLLDALGYPTLSVGFDGSTITMPETLEAGRYLIDVSNTSGAEPQVFLFMGATADHSVDDILAAFQSIDLSQGPPPIYFQVALVDLTSTPETGVITLTSGEWVIAIVGDQGPVVAKFTVSGDLPTYEAVVDAIQVDLHETTTDEMTISMPDTIPAGDHIWQIENTGSMPHMVAVAPISDAVTDEQVQNAIAFAFGVPGATPVASDSSVDFQTFESVIDSDTISPGYTQLLEANLEPGTYLAICFVIGPGDVGPHALLGMFKIFTVE